MLIFCVLAPSISPVFATPFWEKWIETPEISAPEIQRTKLVSLLVEESLLDDDALATKIERYGVDIQQAIQGQVILVPVPVDASSLDLWNGNAQLYFSGYNNDHKSQLIGTVIIGDVPLPIVDKNGRLHATPFPLTDFEAPSYHWDIEENRFVWQSGGDEQAEVWHGIIRSDASTIEARKKDLQEYLERNHQVHQGKETFSKKILVADMPSQRLGISDQQKEMYQQWIDHLEDFSYLRFNKNWLNSSFLALNPADTIPEELLPEAAQGVDTTADFSAMPDVQSKMVIDQMVQRYLEAARSKVVEILSPAGEAGRWNAGEMDTTIGLVAKKDEWAAQVLREANDEVENIVKEKLTDPLLAIPASKILKTEHKYQPYETILGVDTPLGPPITKELYVNGVKLSEIDKWGWDPETQTMKLFDTPRKFPAENCSYFRGTVPDEEHPAGQLAELNRVYDFETAKLPTCIDWDGDDTNDSDREDHEYEGCCAKNIDFGGTGFELSAPDCTVNNGWSPVFTCEQVGSWQCGLSALEYPLPLLIDWEYIGATKPVFDLKGSRPVSSGIIGAQGCEDFFEEEGDSENQIEISTLMFHDEPRLETLQAQAAAQTTNALPADDPRGASFYDTANVFHRINFPSAFDLIGADTELSFEDEKIQFFQSKLEQSLETVITSIVSTPGNSGKITEEDFASTIWRDGDRQQELIDALLWLGKGLEEKNRQVLRGALSDSLDGARILGDENFNGYEVLELVGKTTDTEGIQLEFEKGEKEQETTNTFTNAERESRSFTPLTEEDFLKQQKSGEDLPEGWEENERNDENNCSNVNLLTWPQQCLIPWATALPDTFKKTLSVPFDETKKTSEEKELFLNGNTPSQQEVASLEVSPETISLFSQDITPQIITVKVYDDQGKLMKQPVDVSILADSADAQDFFSLSPGGTRTAVGGETHFSLIPKTRAFGGKFSFFLSAGDISEEIPVSIVQNEISISTDIDSVIAGETQEVLMEAYILDEKNNITTVYDGTFLWASSDLGTFVGGGKGKIKNGKTTFLFIPGTTARKGTILFQDKEKQIPSVSLPFEILPAEAAAIRLSTPEVLVKGGTPQEGEAIVVDRFGNTLVSDVPSVEWDLLGEVFDEKNTISIASHTDQPVSLGVELSDIQSSRIEKEIPVISHPQLLADVQQDSLEAGTISPIYIPISVDKELPGEFDIQVSVLGEAGIFPRKITIHDGEGELSFSSGTRAGRSVVTLKAPGFGSTTFMLDVLPSDPYKIDMATDSTVLEIGDEQRHTLTLRILDRFGNQVPSFEKEISFLQNPGEKWEGSDLDTLTSLGVIDKNSPIQSYLEEQVVDVELSTHPLLNFTPVSPRITNGEKEVEINPKENTSGHLFLVATAEGLVPDTLEMEIVHVLRQEEFNDSLTPKSLFTLLLGHAGGKLQSPSFGNRFLFDGKTQAVATFLEDPKIDAISLALDPSGEFEAKTLQREDSSRFQFRINDVARATIKFSDTPQLNGNEGWEFLSKENIQTSIKENTIWKEDTKIATLLPEGGFYLENGVEILATDSWKRWGLSFRGQIIGTLVLAMEKSDIIPAIFSIDDERSGVFLESLVPDVYVRSFFTGRTTTDPLGGAAFYRGVEEDRDRELRSSTISAKDVLSDASIGWTSEWKPGSVFAAGNTAGESVRIASSDDVILLGDPTIQLLSENETNTAGFSNDIGKVLWRSPAGPIDQVLSGDINGDGRAEIFSRVGNKLFVLYHDRHQLDNFRDAGLLLRFADGAQKIAVHTSATGSLLHFIQLNTDGSLVLHTNKNKGTFQRETLSLGIENPIVQFDVVDLNGDAYEDLVLLDNTNTLWFAYGKNDTWYAAQQVESFAPSFKTVDEKYIAANEQSFPKTEASKFPQLDNFSLRFASIDKSFSWSGETTLVHNKPFVVLSENNILNAHYTVRGDDEGGDLSVVPGKELYHSLRISGNQMALSDMVLDIPKPKGFSFQENSFLCDGCETLPEIQDNGTTLQVSLESVPVSANTTFHWKMVAEDVPPVRYMAEDFDANDGRDDIAVAWQTEGTAQVIQFLSSGVGTVPSKSSGTPSSPFLKTHRRVMQDVFPKLLPNDFDAEATANDIYECLSTQQNDDGVPTILTTRSVEEALGEVVQKEKKTSWIDAIPSIVFLAPGPQSIYIPPFSVPIPIPQVGFPVIQILNVPPYVTPPFTPNLGVTSVFRFYVMPTTSLQVGFGICAGPAIDLTMTPTGVPFPPQCMVIVPQFPRGNSSSGSSGGEGNGSNENGVSCTELSPENEATAQQELFQQLYAPTGDGRTRLNFSFGAPFTIQPMSISTNRQIKAADILSQWVQDQWRELGNFKFPKFRLKLPKFKNQPLSADEPVLSQLKKSPFVDIQTKKITINYPSFSDDTLKRIKKDLEQWKGDAKKRMNEMKEEWNAVGCASFENGEWNTGTETCDASPDQSAALEITLQLAQYKTDGTILRLQVMPIALVQRVLLQKKEMLQTQINAEKEQIEKNSRATLSELQSKIKAQEEKIKNHVASSEREKQASVIEDAKDKLAELEALITEIETLQPQIVAQKMEEARAFLTQKEEATVNELKTYTSDISSNIAAVEKTAEEIDTLVISEREGIITLLIQKINALENISEAEKLSVQEESAATKTEVQTSVINKKEALRVTATEKKAKRTAEVTGKIAEKKATLKKTQETLRLGAKDMFQQVALDPLEQKWNEFGVSVDKNFEALRSYVTEIKKLKEVPKKLKELLEQVKKMADVINEYWSEWIEKNERAVQKWEEFGEEVKQTIQTWKEIPAILKKFSKATSSSNGGSMTRGTMLSWLKNFILSAIKFPIIPLPQIPDVEIDLSEVKIGVKVEVPELEFNEVEVSPNILPPLPNIGVNEKFNGIFAGLLESSWGTLTLDGSLGNMVTDISEQIRTGELSLESLQSLLQSIPALPETPDLLSSFAPMKDIIASFENLIPSIPVLPVAPSLSDMAFEMPPLVLPQLPSLIEPPKFPDFLKIPNLIMLVPKYLLDFLGLISRGIMPVPEWMVAMTVVNATNRTLLLPIDFLPGAKLPSVPKLVLPALSYRLKWDFAVGIPSLVAALENSAAMFNSMTTQLSNASKGLSVETIVPPAAQAVPLAKEETSVQTISLLPENTISEEREWLDVKPIYTLVSLPEKQRSATHGWVASTSSKILSLDDYPQSVPTTYDMNSVPNAEDEMVVEPRILWFDPDQNTTETVTNFPLQGQYFSSQREDLDRDGEDEMMYSIGAQLFLKRRITPSMTEEEEDAEFTVPHNLLEWEFDHFIQGLSPSNIFSSSVEADGTSLQFLPDQTNDIHYFEWILSERPDRIFESQTDAADRMSQVWRRVGFLVRPPATKYEIRPVGAQIESVKGNPIMYGTPSHTVQKFDTDECTNSDTILPFFAEETLFVGKADKSRLLIKTLARKGQVAETREIELRKGEETVVDFAEVCLSRGDIEYIKLGQTEKMTPQAGDYFFSGMRLELGVGDSVALHLFDDTDVTVRGGEHYELHQFDSRKELIGAFKQLSRGNYYGQLVAFQGGQKTWTRSKMLLHDPQAADDTTPPILLTRRGTNRSVLLGQKIEIDASGSQENQELARVWWEVRGKTILDSDTMEYAPTEILKILLPAEDKPGEFPVVLHARDVSGNESQLKLSLEVYAPEVQLKEASARDKRISGKVVSGDLGVEVWIIRERDGRQEILPRTALSKENGKFTFENLSESGGALLRDKYTKEPQAEVLETGRPVLTSEKLIQSLSATTEKNPLQVLLRNERGEEAARVSFVAPQQKIDLPKKFSLLSNVSGNQVQISNPQEGTVWKMGEEEGCMELWDKARGESLGSIDSQGQFKSDDPEVYLKIQPAINEKEPLVFEVWKENMIVAQFSMPVPEKISIEEKKALILAP